MTTLTDIRSAYPALAQTVNGHPLTYLDSAATALKPWPVIEAVGAYLRENGASVHRSVHTLAERATEAYEAARADVARFIGAAAPESVVFTRGATESLNLVAYGYARRHLRAGDEILLTPAEHHSNLVPWQQVALATGARLVYVELEEDGQLSLDAVRAALSERTRLVAVTQASNVLGTINPIAEITQMAHAFGAVVVVDGAQSVPHLPVNVTALDCDFLAFSGHKLGGPTGIGVLYGKPERLEETEPLLFGGEMIALVERERSTWADPPAKFEGGTPNVAGAIGLGAAVRFLEEIGMATVAAHDRELAEEAYRRLQAIDGVQVYGPATPRTGLVAFNIEGVHPHDVAQVFDAEGIAIRAGHHCAQPLMRWLGVTATARASFGPYNGPEDLDALVRGILATKRYFSRGSR
jgi:cysteine desulfurase/selenocysteine lyase